MEKLIRTALIPGLAAGALALSGCADTPKPAVNQAEEPAVRKPEYSAQFQPTYPETFSARKPPARILRDKDKTDPAKMAPIGTLTARVGVGDCARPETCDALSATGDATAGLAWEAAVLGGNFILVIDDNVRERRAKESGADGDAPNGYRASLVSRGIVYRAGDMALLRRVVMQRVNDALRRAEAAEARAKAAQERATAARRALEALGDGVGAGRGGSGK